MKIAFNPSTVAALTSPPNNKDITFDLTGRNIYARGVKFFGTDTWRPVVDNLTSSATDQSLSANMGRYLNILKLDKLRRENLDISSTDSGQAPPTILELKNGYPVYTDPEFANGNNNIIVYDNAGSGKVTITRETDSTCGNSSGYVLKVVSASGATPGYGGWCFATSLQRGGEYTCIFRAKIDSGVTIGFATNNLGTGSANGWLTAHVGTGKWEWYAYKVLSGTANCANTFFFYADKATTWYLSYANVIRNNQASYDGLRSRYADTSAATNKLTTARNINGTSFNGTADITTSIWGTARNITIGSTTKTVNGSTNVSWSLSEIGAAPSSIKNPNAIKFRDINGTTISYDGSSAVDLTAGTYIAKLPYGFNSWASGCTWGNTTGTSFASWNDSTGGAIDFRRDNPSSGKMSIKVDGRVYVNEGSNPVLSSELGNGFWGMRTPDGGNNWIRTPDNGLIPYASGSAGSGHSSLGTSTWYFSTAYIDKVYGSLYGNASNIYFQNDATLTLYAITSGQNSAFGTETVGIQSCFDNQNPVTSTYPSTYTNRCQIALQPRGGRVAIGTTNADYTLHVAGDVYSTSKVIAPKFQVGSYGYIYTGSDLSPTVGGNLANVVISSWYGVSFTSNCCGDYVNTTSVGIDTRYGIIRAAKYEGNWYKYVQDLDTNNTTDTWVPVLSDVKLQHRVIPVAYNNAPSTLDVNSATYAYHLRINSANTWSNWYWSGQSGQPTWLWGSNNGTNMYVWNPSNFSVAQAKRTYNSVTGTNAVELVRGDMADNDQFRILVGGTASNAGYAEIATADDGTEPIYVRQYSGVFTTVKRTLTLLSAEGYSYFPSYINIGGNEGNNSSPNRVWGSNGSDTFLRSYLTSALSVKYATSSGNADTVDGYHASSLLPTNYYWANIKISASSNTQTQPSVNTIYANNWYRSTGNSGWYSETYGGGWYMQDTTWIRTWGSKSIYCDQMIYSSNSIRMSNIYLQNTNEINCTDTLYLQFTNSNKLSLCYGGGNTIIGSSYLFSTTTNIYKLAVEGDVYSKGFRHASVNSNNYILLAGGGYKTLKGTANDIIFLGYLTLTNGTSGTISSSFYCQGASVSYTYTRGSSNGWINVTINSSAGIVVKAATAQVQYVYGARTPGSGTGRSSGAWWTYCDVYSSTVIHIIGMRQANNNNDSWWRGNPLANNSGDPMVITVLLFGYKS